MIYLKIRHIFKTCNIYLKPERFRKQFTEVFDKSHMQFKETLPVIKFQEENIFTNTLPFTDSHFHFFV